MSYVSIIRSTTRRLAALALLVIVVHAAPAAATTFTVSNTNDSGAGSLRQAILDANEHAGADTIWLIIGSGAQTISPASLLPPITDAVLLDGWVQPGYSGAPLIRIDGNLLDSNSTGLSIYAGSTTLRGLVFTRFGTGIFVGGGDGITFRGCYFGTTGSASGVGNDVGLRLYDGSNITLGGTLSSDPNVISGNGIYGIYADPTVTGVTLKGNFIGTNATGTAALANGNVGVVSFASSVTIGGATAAERNVFSGNGSDGLAIQSGSSGVIIRGNYFGLSASGTANIGNAGTGISDAGTGTIIGGTAVGEGNVVSGNSHYGLNLAGEGTSALGNRVGTNAAGTAAIGNVYGGIGTYGSNISIGGTVNGSGNVISGNSGNGIYIGAGSNLAIRRNYIGTDANGLLPIGNGAYAIRADAAPGTQIGTPGNGNVISGNGRGIVLGYDASGYFVRGNIIGLTKDANQAMGNKEYGIQINTADNVIGGTALGSFNQIAASTYYGIFIYGAGATNNRVEGNYIGTNVSLAQGLGNWFGIVIYGANGNSIGGIANNTGNFISDNVNQGIYNWYGSRNRFLRNFVFRNGGAGIENEPQGLLPNDALDADHGPNEGQNFPTVTAATAGAGSVTVSGFLASQPSTQYRVEYFVSAQCEASGFGEGEHYVGFQDVMSAADGKAVLGAVLTTVYVSGFVTATATDPDGNTSEFSPCAAIGGGGAGEFNISADPVLAYEDYGSVQITVTRTLGFSGAVSVRLKTSDGTATAPGDYSAIDQILTFADGEAIRTVTVPIVLDDTAEGDQQFQVDLSEATGGAFLGGQASATVILFDHDPLYPFYTVGDIGVAPPTSGQKIAYVPIRLSAPTDHPVTISYNTDDDTAKAGVDYVDASGQVVFAPGEKVKLVPVTITAIGPLPQDRVFYLRIAGSGLEKVIAGDSESEIVIFGGDRIFANAFD